MKNVLGPIGRWLNPPFTTDPKIVKKMFLGTRMEVIDGKMVEIRMYRIGGADGAASLGQLLGINNFTPHFAKARRNSS